METRPPLPPFTRETAIAKVQAAEDGWNSRNPEKVNFKREIAEGDRVALLSRMVRNPGDRGMAAADLFRLENGKVVEHWDVIQEVPEKSANSNTMF